MEWQIFVPNIVVQNSVYPVIGKMLQKKLVTLSILGKNSIYFNNFCLLKTNQKLIFKLDFKIDQYPEEIVIRHEYDPIKRIWNKNEITIKIESKPFGNGSMRECFRLYVYLIIDIEKKE